MTRSGERITRNILRQRGSRPETSLTSNGKEGPKVARQKGGVRRLVGRTRVAGNRLEARSIIQLGRAGAWRPLSRWEPRWASKVWRCGDRLRLSYRQRLGLPRARTLWHFWLCGTVCRRSSAKPWRRILTPTGGKVIPGLLDGAVEAVRRIREDTVTGDIDTKYITDQAKALDSVSGATAYKTTLPN